MVDVQTHRAQFGQCQRLQQQVDDLDVGLDAGMAIDLGADLDGLARAFLAAGTGTQHRGGIAEPVDVTLLQQMRIDARDLGRDVGPDPQALSGELVHQLEGLQVKVAAAADQQRIQIFDERGQYQLEAVATIGVEHRTAQTFEILRRIGQQVRDAFGK